MSEQTLSRRDERIHPPVGLFRPCLRWARADCIGTGEFAPMSLLPDLARGTGVSIPAAGAISVPMLQALWSVPLRSRYLARAGPVKTFC